MDLTQNQQERLIDLVNTGQLSVEQANVEKIKMKRVHLVTCSIPAQVRKVLNLAVKAGDLGHAKKDGRKPEAYYHPKFEYLVNGERNSHERMMLNSIAGVFR